MCSDIHALFVRNQEQDLPTRVRELEIQITSLQLERTRMIHRLDSDQVELRIARRMIADRDRRIHELDGAIRVHQSLTGLSRPADRILWTVLEG